MSPNKNFKMPKRTKTLVALLQHAKPEMRNSFKSMMIDGHLASASSVRVSSDRK